MLMQNGVLELSLNLPEVKISISVFIQYEAILLLMIIRRRFEGHSSIPEVLVS